MALLILLGMIATAVDHAVNVKNRKSIPADDAPAPAVDALALAIIVVVVILSLTVPPTLTMALLVLLGMIASAVDYAGNMMKSKQNFPASTPAPNTAVHPPAPNRAALAPALAPAAVAAGRNMRRKPASSGIKYEVFLSFRGSDTRTAFTDFLYIALVDTGISVFKDDEELRVGEEMVPELLQAIHQSRISIAILSIDYASSVKCLRVLEQMWECRKLNGQIIIPIFYRVSASDVKHLDGDFGRAFDLHDSKLGSDTIEKWKEALRGIAELPGGYSEKLYDGYESQLIKEVAVDVAQRLRDVDLVVADELVGIDLHVREMMRKLGVAYSEGRATEARGEDVRVVAICGVPGVGKTTLAKVVYNKIHDLFAVRIFLPGISSKGVQFSLHMLIADLRKLELAPLESSGEGIGKIGSLCCNAKVLIVLDDVDEDEQIKALAGKLTWFGPGSRIIVTTNKRKVLSAFDFGADDHRTVEVHEVEPRSDDHALQLFRDHYFRGDAPEDVSEDDSFSIDSENSGGSEPENSIEDNQLTSPIQDPSIN